MNELLAHLRLPTHYAFNPFDVMAEPDIAGDLTIAPGPGSPDIALDDFPGGQPGQRPLVFVPDEHGTAAVPVSQYAFKGQADGGSSNT
ncbi:hypothetical protein IP90_00025 [Luteimonas cucumeris]|uniref:Uncharacterized protein n=1 Tax=Luteimonas cucumeris TaxID=985012 RepID=A0A562LDL2_9GAMM|nr:hypothetical protein IP90_00025 [Luteimonas cucumeris]